MIVIWVMYRVAKTKFSRALSYAAHLGGEKQIFVLLVTEEGWQTDLEE